MRVDKGYRTPSMCCDITNSVNCSKPHGSSRMCIHFRLQPFLLGSRQNSGARSGEREVAPSCPCSQAAGVLLRTFRPGLQGQAVLAVLAVATSSGCSHLAPLCASLHPLDGGASWWDNVCTHGRQTGRRGKGTTRESLCLSQGRKQGQVHI